MIIYNLKWLSNLLLVNEVGNKHQEGLLSEEELKNIKKEYPVGFYSPNIFVRAGMFLLTLVISFFSSALISLLFAEAGIVDSPGWLVFLGIGNYVVLEAKVQANYHYRSGVDDALLWISAGLFSGAFAWAVSNSNLANILTAAFVFVLSLTLGLRFIDRLMALVSYLSLLALIFFCWQETGSFGTSTMPFILMGFSAAAYWLFKRSTAFAGNKYYNNSLRLLQVASLLSLYCSGNYFVVKELGDLLNGSKSSSLPMGWFFWMWTVGLPVSYIAIGVSTRNRIILRSGLLLITAAALTYRNYYQLMPVELALSLAGVLALAFAYFFKKYLAIEKYGFTSRPASSRNEKEEPPMESLLIAETFSETGKPVVDDGAVFGGGEFGGAGATGKY
ncbi:hypothetical protein [Pedobacter sp. SYSU D00535]|uniref:hypothetical protein n=1 Tax=Pedobacter sp. SYSU D00535 TaxID=2810308 RepID=UPI001A96554C|nr:hypothetical protein [Pedobacter sp. SYSU D00535]